MELIERMAHAIAKLVELDQKCAAGEDIDEIVTVRYHIIDDVNSQAVGKTLWGNVRGVVRTGALKSQVEQAEGEEKKTEG